MKIYNLDNELVELSEIISDIFNEKIGQRIEKDEDIISAFRIVKYGFNYFAFYESVPFGSLYYQIFTLDEYLEYKINFNDDSK